MDWRDIDRLKQAEQNADTKAARKQRIKEYENGTFCPKFNKARYDIAIAKPSEIDQLWASNSYVLRVQYQGAVDLELPAWDGRTKRCGHVHHNWKVKV